MANRDREINLKLTADDDASKVIDDVADKLDDLDDGVEVDVDADTRDAETKIERFGREVDDLTDDAREIRFEFRAQQIQRDIRNALRDLERLEDPVEIETRSQDLEQAQRDLRDLADLADRKYEIEIDADPKRSAQRAAGDIDAMRDRGEGLQSAVPALRGFTDELGGAAQGAGIASQAVADLGDTALIFGERFGVSGKAQKALTGFGTAASALGIGGVVVGGAIAGFQLLQRGAEKLAERIQETTDAILDQMGVVDDIESRFDEAGNAYELFADKLLSDDDDVDDVAESLAGLGLTIEDLPGALRALQSGDADALGDLIRDAGGADGAADAIAEMAREGRNLATIDWRVLPDSFDPATRTALESLQQLAATANNLEIDAAAGASLDVIATSSEDARDAIAELRDEMPDASNVDVLDAYVRGLDDTEQAADGAKRSTDRFGTAVEGVGRTTERETARGRGLWDRLGESIEEVEEDVDDLGDAISGLTDERDLIRLRQQAQDTADAFASGEQSVDEQRLAMIDLQLEVAGYLTEVLKLPDSVVTDVLADLDDASVADVENYIAGLRSGVTLPVRLALEGTAGVGSAAAAFGQNSLPTGATVQNYFLSRADPVADRSTQRRWSRLNGSA